MVRGGGWAVLGRGEGREPGSTGQYWAVVRGGGWAVLGRGEGREPGSTGLW